MCKKNIFSLIIILFVAGCFLPAKAQISTEKKLVGHWRIDLAGQWRFKTDPMDKGITEQWFIKKLDDKIMLPGSMAANNKGDDITVNTPWTGSINDSSWFFKPEYAQYRQPGNIKIPFFLQPVKYYKGAAWYQKTISIPASWKQKQVQLFIERSHWETVVWLDNKKIGMQNSLSTAQVFDLGTGLTPGNHQLTIRIDNRIKDIYVGPNAHSITDHTQTNWNGMIGQLALIARPAVVIDNIQLYPDISNKNVRAKIWIKNFVGGTVTAVIRLNAVSQKGKDEKLAALNKEITIPAEGLVFETIYAMGNDPLLWDEFHPQLYSMNCSIAGNGQTDEKKTLFGMREFKPEGTQFTINGRKTFLRGTLECAIFPKTGYPAMDLNEWMRIFRIAKSYGLNHMRFHSWCPPEAAFEAADRSGFYLQVECGSWANQGAVIGDGTPLDQFIYDESERIVQAYGNHPSFCMMAYGNEPAGKNHPRFLAKFVNYWKSKDVRRVYTCASGWPVIPESNYHDIPAPRIQLWGDELKSIINGQPPRSNYDWGNRIAQWNIPVISHEIGQWCVYPDLKEIKKYTGVLKAKNFEIFRNTLLQNGMLHLADSFLLASGKLQSLCYKADIEAALRTPGFGGFQLLDLHDFPGQGTALVGVLNPFWEEKGYMMAKEYRRFCNSTVPLARLPKMIYTNNEELVVPVEIAHFGEKELQHIIPPVWRLIDHEGKILKKGELPERTITIGNGVWLGDIRQSLSFITKPSKLTLSITVSGYENAWDIFVYPSSLPELKGDIFVTQQLDEETVRKLNEGAKVLLTLKKGAVHIDKGGSIGIGFSSIFWNTAWTNGQAPHTLGILVNPKHPAFKEFPTDYHSNWQWWDAMSHSSAIILDSVAKGLQPIVRVIDDWVTARPLGLVFECKVGKGKLLVSSIELIIDAEKRPEARQLLYSLKKYMESKDFNPVTEISVEGKLRHSLF
jgi:hypothetical protein